MFEKLDVDKNGRIDKKEFENFQRLHGEVKKAKRRDVAREDVQNLGNMSDGIDKGKQENAGITSPCLCVCMLCVCV